MKTFLDRTQAIYDSLFGPVEPGPRTKTKITPQAEPIGPYLQELIKFLSQTETVHLDKQWNSEE